MKLFYGFIIFLVTLIVAIVFAANSSFVIKKAADRFAPEYKISYDDIDGNIFTGVKITGLKFDDQLMTKKIKFSWDPSRILYKHIQVNEVSMDDVDVDVIKALIASFPSDDNSTSEPFPFVINVGKVHVSVNPFEEQGILISKTVLDIEDVKYASDEIGIGHLAANIDTNVTNISLEASLEDGKFIINKFFVEDIDSLSLEQMFLAKEQKSEDAKEKDTKEPLNPFIPREVELKHFVLSLKPRVYKTVNIETLKVNIDNLTVDVPKVIDNEKNSINVDLLSILLKSSIGNIDLKGALKNQNITLEHIDLQDIDTLALQSLFANDDNESESNTTQTFEAKNDTNNKEVNNLIPKKVFIKSLSTSITPVKYDPLNIIKLLLNGKDIGFDVEKLMVEKGLVDLNGITNLSNITYSGSIKDNQLIGGIVLTPNKQLFELYQLPIRKEAIGSIKIDLDASKDRVIADIKAKAKQILVTQKSDDNNTDANKSEEFNVDIDSLLSHVVFTVKGAKLEADTKIMLSTPYAKDVSITNKFLMDGNISYNGEVSAKEIIGIDAKFTKPLKNLNIKYSGDAKSIKTFILSDGLKGSFDSSDFKKGQLHIETKEPIMVSELVELPAELNGTKVNAVIDVPLDFAAITPLKAKAKITSNITNLDVDIIYGKTLQVKVTSNMPEDSLLEVFDKNIKWNAIDPLVANVELDDKNITLSLKSKELSTDIKYFLNDGKVEGTIKLAGLITNVKGIVQKKITIDSKVNSMKSLLESVRSFYTLEDLPPLEGTLSLSMDVTEMKQAHLSLTSPKMIYRPDRKTEYIINDVKVVTTLDKSQVLLKEYRVTYNKMKFFSTKPSTVKLKGETIEVSPLWLNDQLKVVGTYNIKGKKGDISADASALHIAHEWIDLDSAINLKTVVDGNKTSVNGKVTLLGGNIHYDLSQKTFASDSDIIIVQDMKKESESPFMDNLSISIKIKTKKPLVYKQGDVNIKAKVDLGIEKAVSGPMLFLGSVELVEGGSYTFEGKKFVLEKSSVHFAGDVNKPILDIKAKYRTVNYLIKISVTGTADTPIINFTSTPHLTREQILSVILFDSEVGAENNSGEDMMKMMGGAMAKSALSNVGVKLDHLVLGAGNSVEVGKKLTDKIMIIYINDEVSSVKLQYDYSKNIEGSFTVSPESSSGDIFYKRDF